MKKTLWVIVIILIISFMVWSKDPLNDAVNFIIGGSIPGSKLSLGFWPMMAVILSVLLLIRRGIKNARLQMLENTAKQIKKEQAEAEFKASNAVESDHKKRSVIAASNTESVV